MKNGMKALDSDMHVYDPPDLYLNYMEKKWGDRIPRGEWPKGHGRVEFCYGDGTVLRPRGERIEQGEKKVAKHHTEGPKRGYDPVSQIEAMEREGLDIAVLFRTSPLYADDNFEPEYAAALCRAWNSWISDFCKQDRAKLKPSAVIPLHDVDLAVKEVRRAVKDLGAVGLSIGPEPVRGRLLHDRYFDPLWAEAQEMNVAVCFHPPASPGSEQASKRFDGHPNDKILVNAFRNPVEQMFAVGSMCGGGVLERFPRLRVSFLEGNCSWLPWTLYRLDERFELAGELADSPLKLKPSEYFRRQCFISVDVDEELIVNTVRILGPDSFVISTDYPHIDSKWPHALDSFLAIKGLERTAQQKILWDNCARLYGLQQ
jgi:predicted TIM-barrel fold metal-dependent hydrolase